MKIKEVLYIAVDDGWYCVFGSETGFCYAQYGSQKEAEKYITRNTNEKK